MKSQLMLGIACLATVSLAAVSLGGGLAAQAAAASRNYLLASHEQASGATSNSTSYQLSCAVGAGVVASHAKSASYVLLGGYTATLDLKTTGQPWLTGVTPRFATPKGGAAVTLFGSELNLGTGVTVKIGGQAATVGVRTNGRITTKLPFQPAPGWQPVSVTAPGFGTSTLPEAIGILPMIFTDPAPAPNVAFDFVFKGSQGDNVILAVGLTAGPPAPLGGLLYGLVLNPIVVVAVFPIANPTGELRFPVPPINFRGTLFAQALFITSNPGYAPGSFSNFLVF